MKQITPFKLTDAQIADYRRNGYMVIDKLLCAEEVNAFLAHEETRPKELDHRLNTHVTDPQWHYLATHPNVAGVAEQLIDGTPRIVQTMYMPKKAAETTVGTAMHQDSHYIPSQPNTLMACWIAMSDTGPDNGGLCVVPGSHLQGLRTTHQSTGDEHLNWSAEHLMRDREGKQWTENFYSFEIDDLDAGSIRKLEIPAGDGVFFTSMTIHGSFANRSSSRDRLAWAIHYVKDGTWIFRADVQNTVAVPELARTTDSEIQTDG